MYSAVQVHMAGFTRQTFGKVQRAVHLSEGLRSLDGTGSLHKEKR